MGYRWLARMSCALVLSLLPCIVYPEFVIPLDVWNSAGERYSPANLPFMLRVEFAAFSALVLPPTSIAGLVGYETDYEKAALWSLRKIGNPDHFGFEPVSRSALRFLLVAAPFWAGVVTLFDRIRVRFQKRRAPAA